MKNSLSWPPWCFPFFLKHNERGSARQAAGSVAGLIAGSLLCAGAPAAEPRAAAGWTYAIVVEDVPAVDNLAFDGEGALYATLERAREGRLVRLDVGRPHTVLGDLDRADGLSIRGTRAYVTEEVMNGRVLEVVLPTGRVRTLARLRAPEGLAVLANGDLLVTEDRADGRLVRIRRNGAIETVIASLVRPEGIALGSDETTYIAETGTGRILQYRNRELGVVLEGLTEPDQLAVAPDGALWITEDARPGRLLRFLDGRLDTVVFGLALDRKSVV